MRKMNLNRWAALMLAMVFAVLTPLLAMAEEVGITTMTDLLPVASEAPVAEEAAPTEAPVADPTAEPTVELAAEPTEAPTAEPIPEPVEAPAEIPNPEEQTDGRSDEAADTAPEVLPGVVSIIVRTSGPLYYGDEVTLGVLVDNVTADYTITWQKKVDEDKWETLKVGLTYKFILTPETAAAEYRAVLTTVE